MRSTVLALAVWPALLLAASAHADITFTSLQDPDAVGQLPGADGLLGTGDDESGLAGTNPDGDLAYSTVLSTGPVVSILAGDIGQTTVVYPGLDAFPIPAMISEFTVTSEGQLSRSFDDPSTLPHQVDVAADQTFEIAYTLASCSPPTDAMTCAAAPEVALVFGELDGRGWVLLRDQDPADLPGLDSDPVFENLVDYMTFLTTVAPADWTAISLTVFSGTVTETNVTGSQVDSSWVGGTAFGVAPFATTQPVPEPGVLAGTGASLGALALLAARRRSRQTSST